MYVVSCLFVYELCVYKKKKVSSFKSVKIIKIQKQKNGGVEVLVGIFEYNS